MAELMMFQPGKAFMDSYNQAKAGSLAKIAFTEPQRRQSALADLYGLDPQAANSMKKEFDAQEQEQLKTFATAFMNTTDDNLRTQMYGRAKEMWRPRFQALGSDIPDDWRQALPTIQALAGASQEAMPADIRTNEWYLKQLGYKPGSEEERNFLRMRAGQMPKAVPYGFKYDEQGNVWVEDRNQGNIRPGQFGGQNPPPQAGSGGIVFPEDIPPAAARVSDIMSSARREIGQLVAGGMPIDQATTLVTQKYANARGLTMPSQGQAPVASRPAPAAQTAPTVAPPQQARIGVKPEAPKDRSASIANETTIRKEFAAQVKPYQDVISAYKRVETAASSPTAAGDLSMIFAYMKMLDPGSVVREGEFANAQNAAGVPDQVLNLYNRIRTGQRLNPQQRADFLKQARGLKINAETSYKEYERQYAEIAKQYEIPIERIIVGPSVTPRGGTIDLNSPDPLGILK